jgi:hypothetical protein
MSNLRRKTNQFSNSNPFAETKGVVRYCASCNTWKTIPGSRKHPFKNYMECVNCVEKRKENAQGSTESFNQSKDSTA